MGKVDKHNKPHPDDGHWEQFQQCEHGDLDPTTRRKRWLRPGTKVMEKLELIFILWNAESPNTSSSSL